MFAKQGVGSIQLQERDLIVLRGLFESRVMTARHIADIYFDGRKEAAKKRLQKLGRAGLITKRPRRSFEPAVFYLSNDGILLLKEQGILAEYPAFTMSALETRARVSDATIRHELEVMDVKAAFYITLRGNSRFTIAEFGTWPRLYEFEASPNGGTNVLVKPDGFIRIHETGADGSLSVRTFFLEVDRSTETQNNLASRAAAYLNYYRSGGFAERNEAPRSKFKEYPYRVLMVFNSPERRNNMAERLLQNSPSILTQVYLSTREEVKKLPLGYIWVCPLDYRSVARAILFKPSDPNSWVPN